MYKYAVSKQTSKNGDVVFAVREFYPNNQGELTSWTADEIAPVGESIDDLRWVLNRMLEALDGEIVDIGDGENGIGQPK